MVVSSPLEGDRNDDFRKAECRVSLEMDGERKFLKIKVA